MSWKKIGVSSANAWTNSEATSDLGERLAIAHDRGKEPAEAERGRIGAGAGEAAGDEHDRAAGQRRRFGQRQVARGSRQRIDQPDRPLTGAAARMAKPPAASATSAG